MAYIHTEMHGHVLVVTLNRPEARNAFDRAMAETMEAVMDDYEGRPEQRVAILRAEGPTFSAGQDLKAAERGEVATSSVRGAFGLFRKPPMKPLIADFFRIGAGSKRQCQAGDAELVGIAHLAA